ncbi:MAG TPA: fibronectin type III-like domain-contianing protein [Sphingobium sp.]
MLNLAGFDRISLKPGQTKTVSFTAGPKQPAIWNRQMKPVIAPSSIDLFIGPDARHLENVTLEVDP